MSRRASAATRKRIQSLHSKNFEQQSTTALRWQALTGVNAVDELFAHDTHGYFRTGRDGFPMKRGLILAFAAALSACAPAPVQMPAAQASEVLNLFAVGRGPANLCSADGRALLR